MTRRPFLLLTLALAGASLLAPTRTAEAQDHRAAHAEIMILHATQQPGAGSIDPSIGNMPQLKKPPFSAYNTYKLLDKQKYVIQSGTGVTQALVNGRALQVTLNELTTDGRYRVTASIDQPGGKTFLKLLEVTAAPKEPFFVAGQSYDKGILVIGITMTP